LEWGGFEGKGGAYLMNWGNVLAGEWEKERREGARR